MNLLYQLAVTLSLFASLGLPQGLVRGFYLVDNSKQSRGEAILQAEEQRMLLGALVTFLMPLTVLITVIMLVFANPISLALFHTEGKALWVRLTAWLYLALIFQSLPLQLYKTQQRSRLFAAWSLAAFALIAAGNVFFIVVLKWGLPGMILGNLLGVGGTAILLTAKLISQVRFNLEWNRLKPLFAFGLPMLPNLLSRKVLEVASRYMLPYWFGLSEVGLFSMGARVASIVDVMLLIPFLYAWQPFFYSLSNKTDAPQIFAKVTHYLFLLLTSMFIALQVFQAPLLQFLGRGKFNAAGPIVSFLVLAAFFNGLQYCVSAGIHLKKKLPAEMIIMACVAVTNLFLNFLLIPRYGAVGASVATAVAYFLYLVGSFFLAQRFYPVAYLWRRGSKVLALAGCAFAVLQIWDGMAAQLTCLLAFLILGPIWDLWRNGEIRQGWNAFLEKRRTFGTDKLASETR